MLGVLGVRFSWYVHALTASRDKGMERLSGKPERET